MTVCDIEMKPGAVIDYTNPGSTTLAVNTIVALGTWGVGVVAKAPIEAGKTGVLVIAGVAEMDAESGSGLTWAIGDQIYYTFTSDYLTSTASSNTKAGIAIAPKTATESTGRILLNGLTGK